MKRSMGGAAAVAACFWVVACEAPWALPPDYDSIFVPDRLVEWKISISRDNWTRLMVDPASYPCEEGGLGPGCVSDNQCPAGCQCLNEVCVTNYVEAEVEADGVRYRQVGLQLMGDRLRAKKTMRIRFNEFVSDLHFHGVKRLNLRANAKDPSLLREALSLHLMRSAGVPAPRFSLVWVRVNDGPGGVYTLVEQVDRKFLEDRFIEDRGNLYQVERGGSLVYQGDNPGAYDPPFAACYELKTNELEADGSDLIQLMKVLDQGSATVLEQTLPEVLDLEGVLRWLAVNSWLANQDSYPGTGDNLYLYQDSAGRFRTIPWDLNQAFGGYHGPSCGYTTDDLLLLDPDRPTCGGPRPLVDRLLSVEAFLRRYHQHLQDLVDGVLHPDRVREELVALRNFIQEYAHQDMLKEFSNQEFDDSWISDIPQGDNPVRVPGLMPFVQARDRRVREILGGP